MFRKLQVKVTAKLESFDSSPHRLLNYSLGRHRLADGEAVNQSLVYEVSAKKYCKRECIGEVLILNLIVFGIMIECLLVRHGLKTLYYMNIHDLMAVY